VNRLRLASCFDQPVPAQAGELLGKCRLAERNDLVQIPDRTFAVGERAQNHQPALVAKRFHQTGRVRGVARHSLGGRRQKTLFTGGFFGRRHIGSGVFEELPGITIDEANLEIYQLVFSNLHIFNTVAADRN
jgi:hypothetical protein